MLTRKTPMGSYGGHGGGGKRWAGAVQALLKDTGYTVVRLLDEGGLLQNTTIALCEKGSAGCAQQVVVKVVRLKQPQDFHNALVELAIMQKIGSSPHVVPLLNVMGGERYMCIVMPYYEQGDLCRRISETNGGTATLPEHTRPLSVSDARRYITHIIKGLLHLKKHNIAHGDVSLENIAITSSPACAHTDAHAHTDTHAHTHTDTHAHAHTDAHTHAHTRAVLIDLGSATHRGGGERGGACACAHTHTYVYKGKLSYVPPEVAAAHIHTHAPTHTCASVCGSEGGRGGQTGAWEGDACAHTRTDADTEMCVTGCGEEGACVDTYAATRTDTHAHGCVEMCVSPRAHAHVDSETYNDAHACVKDVCAYECDGAHTYTSAHAHQSTHGPTQASASSHTHAHTRARTHGWSVDTHAHAHAHAHTGVCGGGSGRGVDAYAVDVWCVGLCLYTMLTGRQLYANHQDASFQWLVHGYAAQLISHYEKQYDVPRIRDPDARAFVLSILKPDPKDRPTIEMLSRHPFVCGGGEQAGPA